VKNESLRITPQELKSRMSAGEVFMIVDSRNPQAWAQAGDMAHSAVRIAAHSNRPLPQLLPDRPVVVYCT
jgi:rhodanese-related sulfurtransferase